MRILMRLTVPGCLVALGLAGLITAPVVVADCNDSSGTTVCAQGDIRGTRAPPPARPTRGAWGTWCTGSSCFGGFGFGIAIGP